MLVTASRVHAHQVIIHANDVSKHHDLLASGEKPHAPHIAPLTNPYPSIQQVQLSPNTLAMRVTCNLSETKPIILKI